ncbi:hypothetical protein KOW79_015446 [Hemibagrus wyckioides]|uniref:Uncharacterized protein n=1 Tax=Hemibagrus wyckioides TaxID=337641 RepID=A0A9D3NE30_9TELE|nr:hypothetical protein KOW79_015446 [Hemibagrus wyckioides]
MNGALYVGLRPETSMSTMELIHHRTSHKTLTKGSSSSPENRAGLEISLVLPTPPPSPACQASSRWYLPHPSCSSSCFPTPGCRVQPRPEHPLQATTQQHITGAAMPQEAADGPKCVVRKMNGLSSGENKDISINDEEIDYSGEGMTVTEQQELPAKTGISEGVKNCTHGYLHK